MQLATLFTQKIPYKLKIWIKDLEENSSFYILLEFYVKLVLSVVSKFDNIMNLYVEQKFASTFWKNTILSTQSEIENTEIE